MTIDLHGLDQDDLAVYLDGLILMSQIFRGPDEKLCIEMKGEAFRKELLGLADLPGQTGAGSAGEIASWLQAFPASENLADYLETHYVRLFVNAAPGIKAPLYQSCYESEQGLLMGPAARKMRQRLEETGLVYDDSVAAPPDHLAVELEYLVFLIDLAHSRKDIKKLDQALDFAVLELRPWVQQFSARLDGETEDLFFPAAARLLLSLLDLAGASITTSVELRPPD